MYMRVMRLALALLAAGTASGASVVDGTNTCLNSTNPDYRCAPAPGVLSLDLSECGITDSDPITECFEAIAHLPMSILGLGDNALTRLPEGIFESMNKTFVVNINLEGNSFQQLPEDTFVGMEKLQWLFLGSNSLTTLPARLFNGLTALWRLDLSDNPDLQCVPSTAETSLIEDFVFVTNTAVNDANSTCACPASGELGACTFDCEAGTEGYICSGGPTPSPRAETPVPSTAKTPSETSTPTLPPMAPDSTPSPVKAPTAATPSPVTPAPVTDSKDAPTPMPTPDTVCNNGIPGIQVGDACCKAGCAQCGGTDCSTSTGISGYGAAECCVDTIMSAEVECGGDVVAPCISYYESTDDLTPTPVPAEPSCSTEATACTDNSDCFQCINTVSVEEADAFQKCVDNFEIDEAGSCTDLMATTCCLAAVSSNSACLGSELFLSYAECFVGTECLPLTCIGTRSVDDDINGAGRLSSPLGVIAPNGVAASAATAVAMLLATAIVANLQV